MGAGVTARPAAGKEPVPTVVFIGRLSANKRPGHAIRAFGLVRRQMPDAVMWVIGRGPQEARLRRAAGPGVIFFGHVPEEEKRERLARAHVLVATSVREGWGLVVTEAAASGTVAIGYDVPGLRDSIGVSGGILTRADPVSLAAGLLGLLSSVAEGYGPQVRPAGVVPWAEVADAILAVARDARSPVNGPPDRMADRARRSAAAEPIPQAPAASRSYVPRQATASDYEEEVLER
jgi:glycosyltransferase involved in cell wall biosynthesis